MLRIVIIGVAIGIVAVPAAAWAEELPKKLTPEERKELEAELKRLSQLDRKQDQAGMLKEVTSTREKALEIARRLYPKDMFPDGHLDLSQCLSDLAHAFQAQSKSAEAEPLYENALVMDMRLHKGKDHQDLVIDLVNLGIVRGALEMHADAEQHFRDALAMRHRLIKGDGAGYALNLSELGKVLHAQARNLTESGKVLLAQDKLAEAETFLDRALELRRELFKEDHKDVAESLNNLGLLRLDLRKYADAERLSRSALAMYKRLFKWDDLEVANALNSLGGVLNEQCKYSEAESFFRAALEMQKRILKEDHFHVANALHNLGGVLIKQGKLADAERSYRDSIDMKIRSFKGDHASLPYAMDKLARVLESRGKLAEAEDVSRAATEMSKRLHGGKDHPDLAACMSTQGLFQRSQGKFAAAEQMLRDSLAMRERLNKGDLPAVALSLSDLALVLLDRGNRSEAEQLCQKALKMRRRLFTKDDPSLAENLNNWGYMLHQKGEFAEAEAHYQEAIDMQRRLAKEDVPEIANYLNNLATVQSDRGDYASAEPHYREAIEMCRRLFSADNPHTALYLANLSALLLDRGQHKEAERLAKNALAMYRRLTQGFAESRSEGETLMFGTTQPAVFHTFLSSVWAMKPNPAAVYDEVLAEKASIGRIYEQRHLVVRIAARNPTAAALLAALVESRRRQADLLLAPDPEDKVRRTNRDNELKKLASQIEGLDRLVRLYAPEAGRHADLARSTPADLQRALPIDAAYVDYLGWTLHERDTKKLGKAGNLETRRYLAFVLTRDKVSLIDLGPNDPIEDSVIAWNRAIESRRAVPAALAATVREHVWAKVHAALPQGVKTVYVSPDVTLNTVAWAAIPGARPGTILLEDYAIALVPHSRFLLDQLSLPKPASTRPNTLLSVGGVNFDAVPPSLSPAPVARLGNPDLSDSVVARLAKLNWSSLPGTEVEAEGIAANAARRRFDVQLLTGPNATVDRVLSGLSVSRFAHLATHGFFADEQLQSRLRVDTRLFEIQGHDRVGIGAMSPMVLSGLVFAGANHRQTPSRGLVTGESLIDRDLSGLELAVLSACETGVGEISHREGKFGLQRAFHLAG